MTTDSLPVTVLSGLPAEQKRDIFFKSLTRAERVNEIALIEHIVPDPVDNWLPAVADRMEANLAGCGDVVAAECIALATTVLNCKALPYKTLQAYVSILSEIPADLLMPSVRDCLSRETYHVMPTPGALVAYALPLLQERKTKHARVRHAIRRLGMAEAQRARRASRPSHGPSAAPASLRLPQLRRV
jgi:hypothetical protein